jgi:hypothetical protein
MGINVPNENEIYLMVIKYSQCPKNIPDAHEIYQHFTFQGPPKVTQIGIFVLKINHLATLNRIM